MPANLFFLLNMFFCLFGVYCVSIDILVLFYTCGKWYWYFDRKYIQSLAHFRYNEHFNNIKSCNSWIQGISLFICVFFDFFHQCFLSLYMPFASFIELCLSILFLLMPMIVGLLHFLFRYMSKETCINLIYTNKLVVSVKPTPICPCYFYILQL